jgi:iron complex outermembrane recepter protein
MLRNAHLPLLAACLAAAPYSASARSAFNIPAQRLDSALIALGKQAQISIGGIDEQIARARSAPVRGATSVRGALKAMLRNSGYDFVMIDAQTVRIIKATPRHPAVPKPVRKAISVKPNPRAEPHSEPTPAPAPPDEIIVVTASKQDQLQSAYPGTLHLETVGGSALPYQSGSAALVANLPLLASTNLGPGRNKIFVRGIADSSFSGPTQSTVGLYLGEMRLTYNAPEPDLRLYDIKQIEVLEGPQGTLYGAGTLGGIIRYVPNGPDVAAVHGSIIAGLTTTQSGSPGNDIAATLNFPLVAGKLALRATGYRQRLGGSTNNMQTSETNTDEARVNGARAVFRLSPGDNWIVDLGSVVQFLDTLDAHYAERGLPLRTRRAAIAQPHENDFGAVSLTISKKWNRLSLLSSTGAAFHDIASTFDATGYQNTAGKLGYREDEEIRLLTHETRLSFRGDGDMTWVAGFSLLDNNDRISRKLGAPAAMQALATIRNLRSEIALFGEITYPFAPHLFATAGARLANAHTTAEIIGGRSGGFEPNRTSTKLLPTAALSWRPNSRTILFLRYQSGYRSGGIAIKNDQINSAENFAADSINTTELGLRLGDRHNGKLSGGITLSHAIWNDVQADLVGASGLPFTSNIGKGKISAAEIYLLWRPDDNFTLNGKLFINDSSLRNQSLPPTSLPNIASLGAHGRIGWDKPLADAMNLRLGISFRYSGPSRLGTVPPLLLEQGESFQANADAEFDWGKWKMALSVSNVTNAHSNSFSYGNPFTVRFGQQITPLSPRSIRLGWQWQF